MQPEILSYPQTPAVLPDPGPVYSPIHLKLQSLKIHFNIIILLIPRSLKLSHPLKFSNNYFASTSHFSLERYNISKRYIIRRDVYFGSVPFKSWHPISLWSTFTLNIHSNLRIPNASFLWGTATKSLFLVSRFLYYVLYTEAKNTN